jgi:hypothetical protein
MKGRGRTREPPLMKRTYLWTKKRQKGTTMVAE